MPVLDEVDAELLKALRVIRGDANKKTGKSSQISQAIVSAIQVQGRDSTDQNAELLSAVKEQNNLLENLTDVLSKRPQQVRAVQPAAIPQQKSRSVPQEEDDEDNCFHSTEESLRACEDTKAAKTKTTKSRSVPPEHAVEEENCFHSTEESMRAHEAEVKKTKAEKDRIAAEQMVADYDNDAGVFAALDKADSDEEEAAAAVVARSAPAPIPRQPRGASAVLQDPLMKTKKKNGKTVITGPWAFVETSVALRRRGRVENSDLLNMEDSLFGKANSTADVLSGDSFGKAMTDFQKTKIERAYAMKDVDGNGFVQEVDFYLWGQKACDKMKVEFTEDKKKVWSDVFEAFFSGTSSKESYVTKIFGWQAAVGTEVCIAQSSKNNEKLFECIDINNDGVVSFEEYFAFISCISGVTEADAKKAFDMIDTNKDGSLSREEVSTACAHYYFDQEDTVYKHFYGDFNKY